MTISRLKNRAGPTSTAASMMTSRPRLALGSALQMLVRVLDHDDGGVDHGADRDRDAAEAHDVRADAEQLHDDHGDQHADRQHDDGDQGAPDVQQEHEADQGDDDALFDQRVLQVVDRPEDQLRPVIDRLDRDAFRQALADLVDLGLHVLDDIQGVLAEALQRDAADGFAFAVELGDAAPLVRAQLDPGDVLQQHRRAVLGPERDLLQVLDALEVAMATDDVFGFGHLDRAAADVHVAGANGVTDLRERDAVGAQALRIDDDLVLLREAADAGDLGHAGRLGDLVAGEPVLDRAQLGERFLRALDDILIDPADAGGVGTERRRHAGRQVLLGEVQVFEHAAARPVDVGAVLEDDVDERDAEVGEAPHGLGPRHADHRRRQRIGDLVLDHLRRLAGIFGVDDDLGIGEIRDGIERDVPDGIDAPGDQERGAQQHQQLVVRRPADDAGDHGCVSGAAAGCRRR